MDDIYNKTFNRTDGQTRCLKVTNNSLFETEEITFITY